VTVNTRRPTLRFPRLHKMLLGLEVVIFWNGSRGGTLGEGDGLPPDPGTPIDYDTPLAGPIVVFAGGHRSIFGGGFLRGGFLRDGCNPHRGHGFLGGPFLRGGFLSGAGMFEWQFLFQLLDGDYEIGIRFRDALGNETSSPAVELELTVAATPRQARKARADAYDAGTDTLTISWEGSPDIVQAA